MISKIKAGNFKCLKDFEIKTRMLTVLAGLNSSGKTSVAQVLKCLGECVRRTEGELSRVKFNSEELALGTAGNVYCQFNDDPDATVSLVVETTDAKGEVAQAGFSFVYEESLAGQETMELACTDQEHTSAEEDLKRTMLRIRHLRADRVGAKVLHDYSEPAVAEHDVGMHGQYAVANLCVHREDPVDRLLLRAGEDGVQIKNNLESQVNAWLQTISGGVSAKTDKVEGADKVTLNFTYEYEGRKRTFSPENVGIGLSTVLPVIVMVLMSKPGDVLILEDPESDLHPRGQAELAAFIARAVKAGIQIFVETHSDHIVNGIRLAVAKGVLTQDKVLFQFIRRPGVFTEAQPIEVDRFGELSDYPKQFLDEWGDLLGQIMERRDADLAE